MEIFAAFFVAKSPRKPGKYAGTTRRDGKVGLPGGKVEAGETPLQAAVRESAEEGFLIVPICGTPIQTKIVDGKPVQWFSGIVIKQLENYKEKKGGIRNIYLTKKQVLESGFGNEFLDLP
jgi:hypothetical protein